MRITLLGAQDEGERLLAPLRGLGAVLDTVAERPHSEVGEVHQDPVDPMPVQERSILLEAFDEQAAKALLEVAGPGSDCPAYVVEVRHRAVGHRPDLHQLPQRSRCREETARAFEPAVYQRLAVLKRRYDPANPFRFNQNIPPIDSRSS